MFAKVKTWWIILRIALEERLVYRGDFMLGTLMRFLPIITQIFLWWAVFKTLNVSPSAVVASVVGTTNAATATNSVAAATAAGASASLGAETTIAGYTYHDMVAYYLLTMISRAFSSMPGLASGISLQIRNGEIKKFLVQPVDLIGFLLLTRVAHKLVYYAIAILPFALVFYLCRGFFSQGWPDALTMLAFISSLIMGFLLGYFLEASIGLIGFWFLEVSSLLFVYMLFSFFLSGHMFPLDMLPSPWNVLVDVLPLKYLAYFQSAVFLGKIEGEELARGLLVQLAWLIFFIGLARMMYWRGVRRYSGFGG